MNFPSIVLSQLNTTKMKKVMTILIIGAGGHLGSLLLSVVNHMIVYSTVYATRRKIFSSDESDQTTGKIRYGNDNQKWISFVDIIMLVVKPRDAFEVISSISFSLHSNPRKIISACASLKTNTIKRWTNSDSEIIRIMPNVFIANGCSVTFVCTTNASNEFKEHVNDVYGKVGHMIAIPEELMNGATVLGASMPAIIAYLLRTSGGYHGFKFSDHFINIIDILKKITNDNGFTTEQSENIINQNLKGIRSRCMSYGNDRIFIEIEKEVATEGGCTEAVINEMKKLGLEGIIMKNSELESIANIIKKSINIGIERLDNLSIELDKIAR